MSLKSIEAKALKLPVAERGKLAAVLLSSLKRDETAEIERAWIEEVERRYRSYRAGRTKAIPAKLAMAAARAGC